MEVMKRLAVLGAVGAVLSIGAQPSASYSPDTLAMLDPSPMARNLCGNRGGDKSLRARLMLAASVSQVPAGAVPLYDGLGGVSFPVTTSNPLAQRYFDQGLVLAYGFNHAGAIRAFQEAQRLDPDCAMCWWGEAFAHGPNINAPMEASVLDDALNAVRQAERLAPGASPLERALIVAIARRYSPAPTADRATLDAAYADAMLAAARLFPSHDELAALAAEAAMDTSAWNYWEPDGRTARPRLGEAISLIEGVLARNPDHPQASHLYIHLMENSAEPRRAEAAADRLAKPLVPGAGHLVHMPAHIYLRLGRYRDSIRANVAAARADEDYLNRSGEAGLVRYGYYPHNVHFIVTSAQMAGDLGTAVRESRRLGTIIDAETARRIAWIQPIQAAPYLAFAQAASPAQILALDEPAGKLPYVAAMRHYARAIARAQQRNRRAFEQEIDALRALRDGGDFALMIEQGVPAPELLQLAELVARGRLAYAERRYADATELYRQAIAIEGALSYMEPPWWYYPVRQSLGAALYRAGRYEDAREAFRGALVQAPNNGWALYGLAVTERALSNRVEAAAAEHALSQAWLGNRKWLRMDRL